MLSILARFLKRDSQTGKGIPELADWLQWPQAGLKSWLRRMPEDYGYNTYFIPKRNGRGRRKIDAPTKPLLDLQRRVYCKLLKEMRPHNAAKGFVPSRSIIDNAKPHVGKAVVINIDLKDFFTNISEDRVFNYWHGPRDQRDDFGWNKAAATILTNICCYQGRLPQGAPTSPALSNLVNQKMDTRLAALVKLMPNGAYTRYADDLAFSFSGFDSSNRWFLRKVKKIINEEGYKIQRKKVRIKRSHQRQTVTGLVVNEKVNLPRTTRRKIRAMQHYRQQGKLSPLELQKLLGYEALLAMVSANEVGRPSKQKSSSQSATISLERVEKTNSYSSSVVAVLGGTNRPIGTGFLLSHNGVTYAATCAHVLVDFKYGDRVLLRHVDLDIGEIEASIHWLKAPKSEPEDWNAFQDIAILKIETISVPDLPLTKLVATENYRGFTNCWCFSFQHQRGIQVEQIDCEYSIEGGFIMLSQNGDVKIQKGASGAPLYNDEYEVVGMIQAVPRGNKNAHLIPTKLIRRALESLKE